MKIPTCIDSEASQTTGRDQNFVRVPSFFCTGCVNERLTNSQEGRKTKGGTLSLAFLTKPAQYCLNELAIL